MKKQFLLTRMLLLCALIIGSVSSAWGETSTLTFKAKCNGSGTAEDGVVWTVTSDGTESDFDKTRGIHYGTSNAKVKYINLSTSGISGTITQIVVNASTASDVSATASVTVGGSAFGGVAQSLSSTATDYTFTGSASGEIIVTVTKPSSAKKALYVKSVTVTYAQSSKEPNGLAWSATSKDVTYNNTPYDLPTLSNPHNLTVSYSSSNTTVATVDEGTGAVTINNVNGYTTITATTEGDDTYAAGAVSYTLNVSKAVVDGEFDFSLSNYGSGIESTNDGNSYEYSESTWTAGNVTMKVTGKYRWWESKGVTDLRLYNNDPLSAAAFSVPDGYVITQIETSGGNFASIVEGDGTLSTNTWTGASQSVKLAISTSTVNFKSIVVTYTNNFKKSIGTDEWATWVAPYNLTVPSGVTAYIATNSATDKVVLTSVDKIKGGTAVILNGSNAEYTFDVTTESVDYPKTNLLTISDGSVTDGAFVLAKKNGTVGFYKWAGGTLGEGRVYLEAPAGAREFIGFDFEDEMTTGINEVKIANNNEYFNLGGQRVAQPKKGLYIVNGKRVIIK